MKAYYQHEVPQDTVTETGEIIPAGSPAIRILRNGAGGRLTTSHQKWTLLPETDIQKEAYADFLKTEWSIPVWEEKVAWLEMELKRERGRCTHYMEQFGNVEDSRDEWKLLAKDTLDQLKYAKATILGILLYAVGVTILYATGTVLK